MHALVTHTLGGLVCSCGQVLPDEAAFRLHAERSNAPAPPLRQRRQKEPVGRKGAARVDPRAELRAESERAAKEAADAETRRSLTRRRH